MSVAGVMFLNAIDGVVFQVSHITINPYGTKRHTEFTSAKFENVSSILHIMMSERLEGKHCRSG